MILDGVDNAILDLLRRDGRMSNREVGRALDISEGMVRQRLKKLVQGKAMRLGLVSDIHASGMGATVVVCIKTLPVHARDVAQSLAQLDACKFVALTLGRYDILAYLVGPTRHDISALIDHTISPLPGIVLIAVREPTGSAKQHYDLVYLIDAAPVDD